MEEERAINLVIPWAEDYRDRAGMNEVVGEGLFPGREFSSGGGEGAGL